MIYLKLDKKPRTIKELLTALFSFPQWGGQTLKSTRTYRNETCSEVECMENKYRSVDNVIEIIQTYFPKTTEKQAIKKLINLTVNYNGRNYFVKFYNCNDIWKPTVALRRLPTEDLSNSNLEHHQTLKKSKYPSIQSVFNIVGLNNQEQIRAHYTQLQEKTNDKTNKMSR